MTRRAYPLALAALWVAGCASGVPPSSGPPPTATTPLSPVPSFPAPPPAVPLPPAPPPVPPPPGAPENPGAPAPAPPGVAVPETVPPPPAPPHAAPEPAQTADAQLAALVEQRLAADPMLRSAVIEAEAHEGQVTLKGTVPSFRERARAIEVALQVPGVRSVRPRLVLQSP